MGSAHAQRIYSYRVANNSEFIRIENGRETRTDFYFVLGGRLAA